MTASCVNITLLPKGTELTTLANSRGYHGVSDLYEEDDNEV